MRPLARLPGVVRAPLAATLVILNTLFWCVPLFVVAVFKLLIPLQQWQRLCRRAMTLLAEQWIGVNNLVTDLTQDIDWDIELPPQLDRNGSYLVIANHQSWADIVVLQRVFNRRIPFLTFFLKKELIWVPVLGLAWWALDFPFMRRYSREYLERHPEKRGTDLAITRRACEKFRGLPVAVMNFVEGTRFRADKHARQRSPYRHLLKPRAGGAAFVLNAMDGAIRTLLDVTIVYTPHRAGFGDLFSGKVRRVTIRVVQRQVPERFLSGDYQEDAAWRENFQAWVRQLWHEKDQCIETLIARG